jgi:thiamine biosynthesis lipoprotein
MTADPIELTFASMGSQARILAWPASGPAGPPAARARAAAAQEWLAAYDARLSRFRSDSELSRLNADRRPVVPASALLRAAVAAALWAAEHSGGLIDPTVADAVVRAGYATSWAGQSPASLADALRAAPPRRPAGPDPAARWRTVAVRDEVIERPPGLALDNGGTGKGLAADALAHRLADLPRFVIDCGGDIRTGGTRSATDPVEIEVARPGSGETVHRVALGDAAIATSGVDARLWRGEDGRFAHHLIDPATGVPAWTGLIGVTAIAPTTLEAETLAKTALLSGPDGARRILAAHGGVVFTDDGDVEVVA